MQNFGKIGQSKIEAEERLLFLCEHPAYRREHKIYLKDLQREQRVVNNLNRMLGLKRIDYIKQHLIKATVLKKTASILLKQLSKIDETNAMYNNDKLVSNFHHICDKSRFASDLNNNQIFIACVSVTEYSKQYQRNQYERVFLTKDNIQVLLIYQHDLENDCVSLYIC